MAEIGFVPMSTGGAVKFGTYIGDGMSERTIDLGVTPKWVLMAQMGLFSEWSFSGLALQNAPTAQCENPSLGELFVSIVPGGFTVYTQGNGKTNNSHATYYYLYGV